MIVTRRKSEIILSSLAFSVAVFGLKRNDPRLLAVGLVPLALLIVGRFSGVATVYSGIFLVLLFPVPQMGWLFGYDAHSEAVIAQAIKHEGWPISDIVLSWGFPETPLIHVHAVVANLTTGLALGPATFPQVLVTAILPMVYVSVALVTTYCLARRYLRSRSSVPLSLALLPVVLWIPLYDKKVAFRRQSIGLLLFVIATLLLYSYVRSRDRRYITLLVPVSVAFVVAHSLTLLFFGVVALGVYGSWVTVNWIDDRQRTSDLLVFVLLMGALTVTWYLIAGYGGEKLLAIVVSQRFFVSLLLDGFILDVPNAIQPSFYTTFRTFYSKFIYAGLLALPIVGGAISQLVATRTINRWLAFTVVYGVAMAGIAVISLPLPFLNPYRIMTLFVVGGGWMAPIALHKLLDRRLSTATITRLFVAGLLVLSASMVPPHVVTFEEPAYSEGAKSERFGKSLYAVASFVDRHAIQDSIVGDSHTKEVVSTTAQIPVVTRYRSVYRRRVPPGTLAVVGQRNQVAYWGKIATESGTMVAFIETRGIRDGYDVHNNPVYDSGRQRVYQSAIHR